MKKNPLQLFIATQNYSSWSMRPWFAMKAMGLEFEATVFPGRAEWEAVAAEFFPAPRLPILVHHDIVVWESTAIMDYLSEAFPALNWWPTDSRARTLARAMSAEMHAGFAALRAALPLNMRKDLPGQGSVNDARHDIDRVCTLWRLARTQHGHDGPFLFGRFSSVDAMFAPVAARFKTYAVELDETCQAYCDAINSMAPMSEWTAAARAETRVIDRYEITGDQHVRVQ
jgi:glutathione S-transferase